MICAVCGLLIVPTPNGLYWMHAGGYSGEIHSADPKEASK